MKNLFFSLIFLAVAIFSAQGQTNLTDYGQNNGTNASRIIFLPNVYLPAQPFLIQQGVITNITGYTNALSISWQYSIDPVNSNWLTAAIWTPSATNAYYGKWSAPGTNATIYQRVLITTTNGLGVGVWTSQ